MDNLFSRSEPTRDIRKERVVVDRDEKRALREFNNNIEAIYNRIRSYEAVPSLDTEEMFRFEVVMIVSALDHYIHEIVRVGIIQIFEGEREETKEYKNFIISLDCVKKALANPESTQWLKDEVDLRNKNQSFQKLDKIKDGLSIIDGSIHKKIKRIAKEMGYSFQDFERVINFLVVRRNQISHQCDIPSGEVEREQMEKGYLMDHLNFIKDFVNRVHREVVL